MTRLEQLKLKLGLLPPDDFDGTMGEWKEKRRVSPLYRILDDTLRFFNWYIKQSIIDVTYWFLYRFHPQYMYHKVDTGLKPGYYDPDTRMLYGCFSLMEEFVEINADHIDWYANDEHKVLWEELKELNTWWKIGRPMAHEKYKQACRANADSNFLADMDLGDTEEELKAKDDEMLSRLVAIRSSLWY